MHTLFSVCGLRDDNVITSKPTWKLKHANSILESFEYFCQISSKSIYIISSYTVSKLGRFLRHSVNDQTCRLIRPLPMIVADALMFYYLFLLFIFYLFRNRESELLRPVTGKLCHVIRIWVHIIMFKNLCANPQNLGAKTCKIWGALSWHNFRV